MILFLFPLFCRWPHSTWVQQWYLFSKLQYQNRQKRSKLVQSSNFVSEMGTGSGLEKSLGGGGILSAGVKMYVSVQWPFTSYCINFMVWLMLMLHFVLKNLMTILLTILMAGSLCQVNSCAFLLLESILYDICRIWKVVIWNDSSCALISMHGLVRVLIFSELWRSHHSWDQSMLF